MANTAAIGATSTSTSSAPAAGATAAKGSSNKSSVSAAMDKNAALGKDEFLKLLITQLRFQDPMNPMEDKEFIAQMAQFNSLEQMQTLNRNFTANSEFSQLTQASSLIGKNVSIRQDEETFPGKVMEVRKVEGELKVMVQKLDETGSPDGTPPQPYDLSTIEQVA